jgi:hypothetical protein
LEHWRTKGPTQKLAWPGSRRIDMETLMQTLNIMAISMATVFGVMSILYVVIRLMVRPEKETQP